MVFSVDLVRRGARFYSTPLMPLLHTRIAGVVRLLDFLASFLSVPRCEYRGNGVSVVNLQTCTEPAHTFEVSSLFELIIFQIKLAFILFFTNI